MSHHNSTQGRGGRGLGSGRGLVRGGRGLVRGGRGRGRGLDSGRGSLPFSFQAQDWEYPQSTCKCREFCEFELMKQEHNRLPQTSDRAQWVERIRQHGTVTQKRALDDPRAFLKDFFGKYELQHRPQYPYDSAFLYDPSKPIMSEFYRMCRAFHWKKPRDNESQNPFYGKARDEFRDALTLQFNALYGTDEDDLTSWQNLCCVLNLSNIPETLGACRNLVASMHVNIVDLIDTPITQGPIIHFKSEKQLSEYTIHTGKYFPRHNAHSGNLLRFLLRRIG